MIRWATAIKTSTEGVTMKSTPWNSGGSRSTRLRKAVSGLAGIILAGGTAVGLTGCAPATPVDGGRTKMTLTSGQVTSLTNAQTSITNPNITRPNTNDNSNAPALRLRPTALVTRAGIFPAYPTPAGLVAYRAEADRVIAETAQGELRQTSVTGGTAISGLSGGLDVNADGFPELFAAQTGLAPDTVCNGVPVDHSQISILDGKRGKLLYAVKAPNCADSYSPGSFKYQQLYIGSVLFGAGKEVYVVRQYENRGSAMTFAAGTFHSLGTSVFPSTDAYGDIYSNAATLYDGTKQITGSHAANGLIITVGGQSRVLFFTSGRVVQYALAKTTPLPLVNDTPFLSHQSKQDRYDDAGAPPCFDGCRNYGTVARVTVNGRQKIILISGTTADTLATDARNGTKTTDAWGGLARHVNVYDPGTGVMETSRYHSYAYDPAQSKLHQYGGRILIPAHPIAVMRSKTFLFYNVYGQVNGRKDTTPEDRWEVSVNEVNANGSLSEKRVPDTFIWDIVHDASGSPILVGTKTSGYWPEKEGGVFVTRLGSGSGAGAISWRLSKPGLPRMAPAFREKDISSSSGCLMSVLVTASGIETR